MCDKKKCLERLEELFYDELEKMTKKAELTPADGDAAHKVLESLTMIDELCCKEEESEMSMRSYGNGYSERRHRNSMGQFTSRSMRTMMPEGDAKRHVVNKLEDMMMHDAPDNVTRRAIDRAINNIEENY